MDDRAHTTGHEAGRYSIRLAGHLGQRWTTRFDGMTLTPLADGTTEVVGDLPDQAALHGLLRTLRDLGIPLVSLTRIDDDPTAADRRPSPRPTDTPTGD